VPILLGVAAAAPAQEMTTSQGWPEVDVWVSTGQFSRLFFLATLTSQHVGEYSDGQFGVHLDLWLKNRRLKRMLQGVSDNMLQDRRHMASVRLGYRYAPVFSDSGTGTENRGIVEFTFRDDVPGAVLLSDRTRFDLRWIDGVYSTRVRNRVTLERDAHLFHRTLTPYGSAELYYDSRYDTINRDRFTVGVQTTLSLFAMIDTYFARQNDWRSQPAHLNALGVALNLSF
jgi:hypothetical protein